MPDVAIGFFACLFILAISVVLLPIFIPYKVQIDLTTENTLIQRKITAKKFEELFYKHDWRAYPKYKNSFFGKDDRYELDHIFASVWMFDGIGALPTNIIEFIKIQKFIKKTYDASFKTAVNKYPKW